LQTVVVATHNSHKVTEIRDILSTANWQLISLSEAGIHDAAIEDADTFVGNAILKARFAHLRTGLPALADDSGLVVDALGGAPGIFSSRYAGEDSDDEANIAKLLQEMADIPDEKRTARFVCATVFIGMAGDEHIAVGSMDGQIAKTASGSGGFGYDPVFIPESSATKKTLAEFSDVEKNAISHRYRALLALQESLESKVTVKTEPDQPVLEQKSAVKIAAFDLDGTLLDAASPVRLVLRLTKDRIMPMRASIRVAAWGVHYKMGSEPDQSLPRHYIFRSLKNVTSSDADAIMRNL
jgi:XTP/dITP diphosphohydrolase